MNILAAADLHGQRSLYESMMVASPPLGVQAIVLAGDLLGYAPGYVKAEEAQRADARWIYRLLLESSVPIFYVLGNDDLVELGPDEGPLRSIDCRRLDLGSYNFVGYRYTLPFMGGEFEKTEEGIAQDLEILMPLADAKTVFVTHSPAKGRLDGTMLGTHAGSDSILAFIERTDVRAHIHGHVHRPRPDDPPDHRTGPALVLPHGFYLAVKVALTG